MRLNETGNGNTMSIIHGPEHTHKRQWALYMSLTALGPWWHSIWTQPSLIIRWPSHYRMTDTNWHQMDWMNMHRRLLWIGEEAVMIKSLWLWLAMTTNQWMVCIILPSLPRPKCVGHALCSLPCLQILDYATLWIDMDAWSYRMIPNICL